MHALRRDRLFSATCNARRRLDPEDARVHGGRFGHWLRRLTHLALAAVPCFYYDLIPAWGGRGRAASVLVAVCLGGALLTFEAVRLRYGLLVIGQRGYERARLSGAAWTVASGLVVLLTGELLTRQLARSLAYPVFVTAAVIDPLMGECRRRYGSAVCARVVGLVAALAIWVAGWWLVGTPAPAVVVGAAVAVLAEGPWVAPLDDNGTVILLPWAAALLAVAVIG